jgi:hypothetical protein
MSADVIQGALKRVRFERGKLLASAQARRTILQWT